MFGNIMVGDVVKGAQKIGEADDGAHIYRLELTGWRVPRKTASRRTIVFANRER